MFNIEVEKTRKEQEVPYADSVLEYKITIKGDIKNIDADKLILDFCTKSLTYCNKKYDGDREFYEPYYKFAKKKDENYLKIYYFSVISPFLD